MLEEVKVAMEAYWMYDDSDNADFDDAGGSYYKAGKRKIA